MLCAELEIGANFSKSKSNFFCDNNWFLIHPLLQLLVGQKNEKQRKTKQNKQRSKKQKTQKHTKTFHHCKSYFRGVFLLHEFNRYLYSKLLLLNISLCWLCFLALYIATRYTWVAGTMFTVVDSDILNKSHIGTALFYISCLHNVHSSLSSSYIYCLK